MPSSRRASSMLVNVLVASFPMNRGRLFRSINEIVRSMTAPAKESQARYPLTMVASLYLDNEIIQRQDRQDRHAKGRPVSAGRADRTFLQPPDPAFQMQVMTVLFQRHGHDRRFPAGVIPLFRFVIKMPERFRQRRGVVRHGNRDVIADFLLIPYGSAERHKDDGIEKKDYPEQEHHTTVEDAVAWAAEENAAGRGVYMSGGEVAGHFHKKRASKDDIVATRWLWIDIDPPAGLRGDDLEAVARWHHQTQHLLQ